MDTFAVPMRHDHQTSSYNFSPITITSVHECPVSKLQIEFSTPRQFREKKKHIKVKTSMTRDQSLKNSRLDYLQKIKDSGSIRWYLDDEITLAKDIFWMERQRVYNVMMDRAVKIAKKKRKSFFNS